MTAWRAHAACQGHKTLPPDAWFDMSNGFPQSQGIDALEVCLNVCPVREECKAELIEYPDKNWIFGGGWVNNRGVWRELSKGLEVARKWRARALRERLNRLAEEEQAAAWSRESVPLANR